MPPSSSSTHSFARRASGKRRRKPFDPHKWACTIPNLRSKILCLGVSYPSVSHTIESQNTLSSKVNLFHVDECVEQSVELVRRNVLTEMDGRDLARCLALEAYNDAHAYTVSLESGAEYGGRHLMANFNRRSFVQEVKAYWGSDIKFRQIILDYFWIPSGSWVMTHWSRSFFDTTLPNFVKFGLLDFSPRSPRVDVLWRANTTFNEDGDDFENDINGDFGVFPAINNASSSGMGGCSGVVYLPFCLHCIKQIVGAIDTLSKYYAISFLSKSQLFEHALWAATSTIDANAMQNWLGKAINQEDTYCTFHPREFLNSADDDYVHKEEVLEVLRGIENFCEVRMIKLKALKIYDPFYLRSNGLDGGIYQETAHCGDFPDKSKKRRKRSKGTTTLGLDSLQMGINRGGFVGLKHPDEVERGFDFERMTGGRKNIQQFSHWIPSKLIVIVNGELVQPVDAIADDNHCHGIKNEEEEERKRKGEESPSPILSSTIDDGTYVPGYRERNNKEKYQLSESQLDMSKKIVELTPVIPDNGVIHNDKLFVKGYKANKNQGSSAEKKIEAYQRNEAKKVIINNKISTVSDCDANRNQIRKLKAYRLDIDNEEGITRDDKATENQYNTGRFIIGANNIIIGAHQSVSINNDMAMKRNYSTKEKVHFHYNNKAGGRRNVEAAEKNGKIENHTATTDQTKIDVQQSGAAIMNDDGEPIIDKDNNTVSQATTEKVQVLDIYKAGRILVEEGIEHPIVGAKWKTIDAHNSEPVIGNDISIFKNCDKFLDDKRVGGIMNNDKTTVIQSYKDGRDVVGTEEEIVPLHAEQCQPNYSKGNISDHTEGITNYKILEVKESSLLREASCTISKLPSPSNSVKNDNEEITDGQTSRDIFIKEDATVQRIKIKI